MHAKGTGTWLESLLVAVATDPMLSDLPPCVVAFNIGDVRHCVGIPKGILHDPGASADCEISCSETLMNQFVRGELSLQRAYTTRLVSLQGDPDILLRVAQLFEASRKVLAV